MTIPTAAREGDRRHRGGGYRKDVEGAEGDGRWEVVVSCMA